MAGSLATPESLRKLQRKLYHKAKQEEEYRFYTLYDKVYREDSMAHAYRLCRANGGAPGVDGQTFADIESQGLEPWLTELAEEVKAERYRPQPVRRVMIPKPDGVSERPLGIPTIRDRVVQTTAKLVLEPIFEADFKDAAYGYRPRRSAIEAVGKVHQALIEGRTEVLDADLAGYFDTIPHAELMKCVARRISDGKMLHLINMWLKSPVEETDDRGRKRYTGGKKATKGTPQGGVISPLLANIYMHRYIKAFYEHGLDKRYGAVLVNYADDFVVLCRHGAREIHAITKAWMKEIGLTLNEDKTRVLNAHSGEFDFLGYTFKSLYWKPTGSRYLGVEPSKKAVKRLKQNVYNLLRPGNTEPWGEVVEELNRKLGGWNNYFCYGTLTRVRREVDYYVLNRVRHFHKRRSKLSGRGTRRFSEEKLFGEMGVLSSRNGPRRRYAHAL
ncbi:MAG: group II intron reverse transcriptase/maturase [Actinobacteria bacterium]|nr:group II intron reverse transcriptase/maturase [Actinomycetota bacterium]MCG2819519.1 group II intron reverse transcriptase/maturase [Actinomycetes bacterium]MBU4218492.1 group II intron reverse transcriptase/maturase [Actinomycetota bacterium]MBU4360143.1 group II intron reverse transcriptase/maturase [Actinomycetota bacterium]MBU4401762.1 group II intron reverse transcriptase/maturase [Actinomycetota bacterium]